jgi:hypothetical protein
MKARVFEFEGPPEQVAAVIKALQAEGIHPTSLDPGADTHNTDVDLPTEVVRWLDSKNPPSDRRRRVEAFLSELLAGGDVRVKIGASSKNADGLANRASLYKIDKKGAAFAYLGSKGKLWLRLPKDTPLNGFSKAQPRNVTPPHDSYGIMVVLESEDGVTDAMKLSRLALERI